MIKSILASGLILIFLSTAFGGRLEKVESNWGGSVDYTTQVNAAEPVDAKTFRNTLGTALNYKNSNVEYSANLAFTFISTGNDVVVDNNNPLFEDFAVSASSKLYLTKSNQLAFSAEGAIPISENQSYDPYYGILNIHAKLHSTLNKYFTLGNTTGLSYIFNKYYYSPVSETVNPKWLGFYKMDLTTKFTKELFLILSGSTKLTQDLSGGQTLTFNQSAGILYAFKKISAILSYSNGNYFDEGPSRYLAFDKYRRNIMLRFAYAF